MERMQPDPVDRVTAFYGPAVSRSNNAVLAPGTQHPPMMPSGNYIGLTL